MLTSTEPTSRSPEFGLTFRSELLDLLRWRRDVRSFSEQPLPEGTIERLVGAAALAPSVGLSQPWRFVVVETPERRAGIQASFERANSEALKDYSGDRASLYAQLKLSGLRTSPCQFAVFADTATEQGSGLGRRTMPATLEYSAVMAVYSLWLVARAEGIGLGWVSIIDPREVSTILEAPPSWTLIGYFCLGYPSYNSDTPELESKGWERRKPPVLIRR